MEEEEALIIALKEGSENAFKTIYERYARRLYAFIFSYVRSRTEAEDILQNIFVKLWQHRQTIKNTSGLKGLLFTIGRNQLVSVYRKRVNMPAYEDYMIYTDVVGKDENSNMEYEEFGQLLRNAMARLPLRQQEIIKMSKFEGMKNREIAVHLNLSEQTIKNQLSLGLKLLKEMLKNVPLILIELMFVTF